jgi:hypothetical protein
MPQARAVDVTDIAKIEQNFPMSLTQQLDFCRAGQPLLQKRGQFVFLILRRRKFYLGDVGLVERYQTVDLIHFGHCLEPNHSVLGRSLFSALSSTAQ